MSRRRLLVAFVLAGALLQAAAVDLTQSPATPPIPDLKLPNREEFKLPNGLTVMVAKDSRFPLITVRLAFLAGSKYDTPDLPGLSDSVAALLNQGTATRSARQIAEQAADLGGQVSAASRHDDITVS